MVRYDEEVEGGPDLDLRFVIGMNDRYALGVSIRGVGVGGGVAEEERIGRVASV